MTATRQPAAWLESARRGQTTAADLRAAAERCRACDLWRRGTQTVFGEGPARPRVVCVGEQPGDREDRAGRPFVGPAGRLLDEALERVGIARDGVWVTNAVKHFKWRERGKRRIHEKPSPNEVRACRPWLLAEIAALQPDLVVCLGATAAQSLLGPRFRVTKDRGRVVGAPGLPPIVATVHPSSLLRAPDAATRRRERARFEADLRGVASLLQKAPRRAARRA